MTAQRSRIVPQNAYRYGKQRIVSSMAVETKKSEEFLRKVFLYEHCYSILSTSSNESKIVNARSCGKFRRPAGVAPQWWVATNSRLAAWPIERPGSQ